MKPDVHTTVPHAIAIPLAGCDIVCVVREVDKSLVCELGSNQGCVSVSCPVRRTAKNEDVVTFRHLPGAKSSSCGEMNC